MLQCKSEMDAKVNASDSEGRIAGGKGSRTAGGVIKQQRQAEGKERKAAKAMRQDLVRENEASERADGRPRTKTSTLLKVG